MRVSPDCEPPPRVPGAPRVHGVASHGVTRARRSVSDSVLTPWPKQERERERRRRRRRRARAREHRAPARVKDSADPGRDSNPATGPPSTSHIACTRDARLSDRLSSLSWSTSTPHQHEHQLLADEGSASTARPRPRRAAAELVPIHAREGQESESLRRWWSSLTLDLGVGGRANFVPRP